MAQPSVNRPWFQLVASLVAMVMIANLQYAWTLFVRPIQEATSWKLSEIQWAFTLFVLFQTWIQPLQGWLIDRMGPRYFITVAGILCGVGWSWLGHVRSPMELYVFYSLAGIGAAFVYNSCIGLALKWFPERRGLASGIIAAGFGSGTALFVPVIAYLIRQYDYRTAFLWTGIFQGLVIVIAAQFLRHPGPDFRPAKKDAVRKTVKQAQEFTSVEMLRTPQFYLLYAMFVLMSIGGLLVTAHAGPIALSWNLTVTALTVATALNPIANGASRIFWGWISDRLGRETTMGIAFALQAACLLAILTSRASFRNLVHNHAGVDVLHLGRDFFLVSCHRGRLFRNPSRHFQLCLSLQRQGGGIDHRRRRGCPAFRKVRKLDCGFLWQRLPGPRLSLHGPDPEVDVGAQEAAHRCRGAGGLPHEAVIRGPAKKCRAFSAHF